MSVISVATQTTQVDFLLAMQLRLEELKSILLSDEDTLENKVTKKAKRPSKKKTIAIGSNKTKIDKSVYHHINWDSYSLATRALVDAVFDKETLARSTVTGVNRKQKSSQKPRKEMLDPLKISDIVEIVHEKCEVEESCIRKIIGNKCRDTAKLKRFKAQINV